MPTESRAEDPTAQRPVEPGDRAGDEETPPAARRRTPVVLAVVVAAVVLVTACVAALTWSRQDSPDASTSAGRSGDPSAGPSPGPSATAAPQVVTPQQARRATSNLPAERPERLVLPDGTRLVVAAAGTRGNGVLDVPDDVDQAGWWDGSASIGDPFGAVLVAAHVDSVRQGLGPFAQLLSVKRGARVTIGTRHLRQTFSVTSLEVIPRAGFARRGDLTAASGAPRLILVTCAGPYDAGRGGYQNLAVVTAAPVRSPVRHALSGGE